MSRCRCAWTLVCGAAALLLCSGCSEPEKPDAAPASQPAKASPQTEKLRERTRAAEARLATAEQKVRALPDGNAVQIAEKARLQNLVTQAKVESLRKNRLDATIPELALQDMEKALDQVEKDLPNFPK